MDATVTGSGLSLPSRRPRHGAGCNGSKTGCGSSDHDAGPKAAANPKPAAIHLKYSVMTCISKGEADAPFRLASITRRQISTVAWLSLIHISEPTRRTPISYAVFCLK